MASRTQLRLAQLTGSVDDTKAAAAAISETSIQGVLDHLAASIKRIHGGRTELLGKLDAIATCSTLRTRRKSSYFGMARKRS